eukprot:CAMPEP_0114562300 /NCGR_PEP_ID=MMETSP0114-20121206/12450_1 /TAXON_ID=31324 /ORGANISM="Goniomonas sp, Strain m" /LENGTH=60 /DNA_ID=CAMNT_0001747965 /DNA_START=64 /DNA_END=243 /DNA_ORIENTATION=+
MGTATIAVVHEAGRRVLESAVEVVARALAVELAGAVRDVALRGTKTVQLRESREHFCAQN